MPKTATTGRPDPNGNQFAPPSCVLKTPMSVPAKTTMGFIGSIASALTGTSGMPLPLGVQVGGEAFRLVVL